MGKRDVSKGVVSTGVLTLNQGMHQYRMRIDRGVFVIDHYDAIDSTYKNDFVVYPTAEGAVDLGSSGSVPAAPPTVVSSGSITTPTGTNLVLSPSSGDTYVNGTLNVVDKLLTLNAVAHPTDLNADGGGIVLNGTGALADPQKISLLWNKNGIDPYWLLAGGNFGFEKSVGSGALRKRLRYMFVIDDATEQLQLWKTVDENAPRIVQIFNADDNFP